MITYDFIIDAQKHLVENWGEDGKKVIVECAKQTPFNGSVSTFLESCTACGGNWGGMLLTGVKRLYPTVYDCIPDDMGHDAWLCICSVLILCGIDTA